MDTSPAANRQSDASLVRLLNVLVVTSLLPGVTLPVLGLALYAVGHTPPPQPKYMKLAQHVVGPEERAAAAWRFVVHTLLVLVPTLTVHLCLTTVASRRRSGFFLGFRGGGWLVLLWTTFAIGFIPTALLLVISVSRGW